MPRYGFNFQWMSSAQSKIRPAQPDEKALDFLAELGFNFVRIPTDYRFWTKDFDYFQPDEAVFEFIDRYVTACRSRGLHLCLNLHHAPGYCINGNELEKQICGSIRSRRMLLSFCGGPLRVDMRPCPTTSSVSIW